MASSEGDDTSTEARSPGVGPPPRVDLPMFTYGLLKPGQLAHRAVIGADARCEPARLRDAALRLRDGLPVLDITVTHGAVEGCLVWFEAGQDAYRRVGEFEPRSQYRWHEQAVLTHDGRHEVANVLIGRRPQNGSTAETFDSWDIRLDPVLTFGFEVASTMLKEVGAEDFPVLPGESYDLWDRFFRLSSAYLLLWSVVERYTALRFGPSADPHRRVRFLDESPEFRSAVQQIGAKSGRKVVDSRDPDSSYSIKPDGSSAAQYWYAVRSNLSHRGKGAFKDGQLLRQCARDLRAVMEIVLDAGVGRASAHGLDPT